MLSEINLDDSSIAAGWSRFDDPAVKAQLVTADSDLHDSCIAELLKIQNLERGSAITSWLRQAITPERWSGI